MSHQRTIKLVVILMGMVAWTNAVADLCGDIVAGVNAAKDGFESIKGAKETDPDIGVTYSTTFQISSISQASCLLQEDGDQTDKLELVCSVSNKRGVDSSQICNLYPPLEAEFNSCVKRLYPSSKVDPISNSGNKIDFKSLKARSVAKNSKGFQIDAAISKNIFNFQAGRQSCQVGLKFSLE